MKWMEAHFMLHKLNPIQYSDLIKIARTHDCGCVYPLSVAEGIQEGDIFTKSVDDLKTILFWTQSGFAYLSGNIDESFLEDIYEIMMDRNRTHKKRFILMSKNQYIDNHFMTKQDVCIEKRYLFEYQGDTINNDISLPSGYELKEIDNELLTNISGSIVPSLFWKDVNDFLKKGKGYCICRGDDVAAWAFSAAVSTEEIDIGIETNPRYQQQGLGMIVAKRMIQYTFEQFKHPVWACHYKNIASAKMAEKLGFVKVSQCSVIKKDN